MDDVTEIPASHLMALLRRVLEVNPGAAVVAGATAPMGTHPLLDYTNASCATLGDVVHSLVRYFGLVSRVLRWDLLTVGALTELRLVPTTPAPEGMARAVREFTLVYTARRFAELMGRPVVTSLCVDWSRPSYGQLYMDAVGPRVRFDSPFSALRLATADLALPNRKADERLRTLLLGTAEATLERLRKPATAADQVHGALMQLLPNGLPGMPEVSRKLGLSPRTLRRRLAQEGTAFESVRDGLLSTLARPQLREGTLSIEEIAYALGFSETRAFSRAFQRWTGVTPGRFRTGASAL